jgi:hypothetical protein
VKRRGKRGRGEGGRSPRRGRVEEGKTARSGLKAIEVREDGELLLLLRR